MKAVSKRVAKSREKYVALGLKRIEDWAKPEHHAQIKKYIARLRGK